MARPKLTPEERIRRFWARVGPPDAHGCRKWTGATTLGYGNAWDGERGVQAHAFAWRLTYHGPTKPGAEIFRHSCDHPWCCEPAHAYPGTHAENIADRDAKGRQASGDRAGSRLHPDRVARGDQNGQRRHPERTARGERVWTCRLNEDNVRQILQSTENDVMLAKRYGVKPPAIWKIKHRRTWRHVALLSLNSST